MSVELLYILGTLAIWSGGICTIIALSTLINLMVKPPGFDAVRGQGKFITYAVAAALLLLIGRVIPMESGRPVAPGVGLPVVWALMPWTAWLCTACVGFGILRVIQSFLALNPREAKDRLIQAACYAFVALFAFLLFKKIGDPITVFRGVVRVSPMTGLIVLLLALATIFVMAWIARTTAARGIGKTFASHLALLAGSILFGIPFAWLFVTSLKEEKDIAGSSLNWTTYKTVRRPYDDPVRPLYEATYKGSEVVGRAIEMLPDGRIKLDIDKPMSARGTTFEAPLSELKRVPNMVPVVEGTYDGKRVRGLAIEELADGTRRVMIEEPSNLKGKIYVALQKDAENVREVGLNWSNYPDALDFLPPETNRGLLYLKNTMILVVLNVIGAVISSTMVAYAFSRLRFFGKNFLFALLMSTMMLPAAVTMLPTFLIHRALGWVDTLYPLWVGSFFAGAFNVFLLRQFFANIPMELEDAAKIDGCNYFQALWRVMVPQIRPALAAISVMTAMGAWNNFMGPLIYISSPEKMPIAYALQLFSSSRGGEQALVAAFTSLSVLPVILLFFVAQRYFIEGVTLSGLGGR